MKLLIVDDQQDTLQGLLRGIDWTAQGFSRVDGARNAMEARKVFREGAPDVMLCDIEMPVESGIDLGKWIRRENYQTQIIYLTCHSEFVYAKEALELRAVDYILQPAPYSQIVEVVRQAVSELHKQEDVQRTLEMAALYESRQKEQLLDAWRKYLSEPGSRVQLPDIRGLDRDTYLWVLLLQVIRWKNGDQETAGQFREQLHTQIEEILVSSAFYHEVIPMEEGTFAVILQKKEGERYTESKVRQYLQYFLDLFELDMPCEIAIHYCRCDRFAELPEHWQKLVYSREKNAGAGCGIYSPEVLKGQPPVSVVDQMKRWQTYLVSHQPEKMEAEARDLVFHLVAQGQMGQEVLLTFYQEFMKILFTAGQETRGRDISELFQTREEMDIYSNGMKSLEGILDLIHLAAVKYTEVPVPGDQQDAVAVIKNYIDTHLDQNITMEEIATEVHLNADYATRIFKKETGMSIKSYMIQQKMLTARDLLQNTNMSVSHVAIRLGYTNLSHFSASYKKYFGVSPVEETLAHR